MNWLKKKNQRKTNFYNYNNKISATCVFIRNSKRKRLKNGFYNQQVNQPLSPDCVKYKYLPPRNRTVSGSLKRISSERIVIEEEVFAEGTFGFIQVATLIEKDGKNIQVAVKVKSQTKRKTI